MINRDQENEEKGAVHLHHTGCLQRAALFANLTDEVLLPFQQAAQMRSYKKGKVLYLQADPAKFFYVICKGWIKLFHVTSEGEEVIVDLLTAHQLVGESAVFEASHHTSNAEVIEHVQLLSIPAEILTEQIRSSPLLARNMLSIMSRQHRRHYGRIALNAMQSAPERIGCFLLRLCPEDRTSNIVFQLPYDKSLIAQTLGMKNETFSRALNILRQKTGVRIKGSQVEIDSTEILTEFVYGPQAQNQNEEL